jgi:hypothetical protein
MCSLSKDVHPLRDVPELHPSVLGATLIGRVICDGLGASVALDYQAILRDVELIL